MPRYIDVDELSKRENAAYMATWNRQASTPMFTIIHETLQRLLKDAPTVDAKPVVHGRWVDRMIRDWCCSECGELIAKVRKVDGYCYDDKPNYCPNCGADMREGKENEETDD